MVLKWRVTFEDRSRFLEGDRSAPPEQSEGIGSIGSPGRKWPRRSATLTGGRSDRQVAECGPRVTRRFKHQRKDNALSWLGVVNIAFQRPKLSA